MAKEEKLIQKVKRIITRAGLPRWLHRYGPKKYHFWQHALALFIKQECKLSYRRVVKLLVGLGLIVPTYSALAKMLKRVPVALWQMLLAVTVDVHVQIAALDGTGMSRILPSPYYIKRIDKEYPSECPLKLCILVDTQQKKILALRVRAKVRHDILDVHYLLEHSPARIQTLVADKAYDAEHVHEYAFYHGMRTHIPLRAKGHKGFFRMKSHQQFQQHTYNRRNMVESVFFMLKRKFGPSVSSTKFRTQRAELYCRAIMHNLSLTLQGLFQLGRAAQALKTNHGFSTIKEVLKQFASVETMYCSDAIEWDPSEATQKGRFGLVEFVPVSAAVMDPSRAPLDMPFGSHQTIYPAGASILFGKMPKGTVYTDYTTMAQALVHGLYGEHAGIEGRVFFFDEPILHKRADLQRGSLCELYLAEGKQRLSFHQRMTLAAYLANEYAALTLFVPPPFSNNGHRMRIVQERAVVLLQAPHDEQQRLAGMIDDFCRVSKGKRYLVADVLHKEIPLEWDAQVGLHEQGKRPIFRSRRRYSYTPAPPPPPISEEKLTPVDWSNDDTDDNIWSGFF